MWVRLVKLLKVIDCMSRPGGARKKEIYRITGTGERSFYRMIEDLQKLGIPLYDEKPEGEKERVWRILEPYTKKMNGMAFPTPDFTISELFALCFLKGSSSVFQESEISRYIDSSYEKLKVVAPERLQEIFLRMEKAFIGRERFAKNYSGHENIMMDILEAIIARKKCQIRYCSYKSRATSDYLAKPLHFFQEAGGLYLLLHLDPSGEPRTFAIERVENVTISEDHFDYPKGFDASEYLNRTFGLINDPPFDVRIWFSSDVARYIAERKWARHQTLTEYDDGSAILEMNTSGWPDVKKWILGYGRNARVLAPEKMRLEIIEEAGEILKNNGG